MEEEIDLKDILFDISFFTYLQGHYVTFKPVENFCIIVI